MRLYMAARLFVNFFQPSFKLKEKVRLGARVIKRYHPPLPPYARLMASEHVDDEAKRRLQRRRRHSIRYNCSSKSDVSSSNSPA